MAYGATITASDGTSITVTTAGANNTMQVAISAQGRVPPGPVGPTIVLNAAQMAALVTAVQTAQAHSPWDT